MTQATSVNPDPKPQFWLGKFAMTDEAIRALDRINNISLDRRGSLEMAANNKRNDHKKAQPKQKP